MSWDSYETIYLTDGRHFCKITDAQAYYNGKQYLLRIKFANGLGEHNETYFISAKSIWRLQKLIKDDLQFPQHERDDFKPKDRNFPENDMNEMLAWVKKYMCGKLVKLELVTSTYDNRYLNINKIRQLTADERVQHAHLEYVQNTFPEMQPANTQPQSDYYMTTNHGTVAVTTDGFDDVPF